MDVVASFIESVSTTKNYEERSRAYQNFQQKVTQLEGVQDEETPPEKSMLALARVMNIDADSRIAHLQKSCVGVLEMLLVTDILSEDARTVFIESLLREPASNTAHKLAFKVFRDKVSSEIKANILNPNVIFGTRHSLYKTVIEAIIADLPKETSAQFLVTKIVPAMYQRHMENELRESAIELAMHFDVNLIHLSASDQEAFANTVMEKYCPVITDLIEVDYENWHKLWIFTIKFCGIKFHSMMVLANRLLKVIEEAFRRRTVPNILKGYECWLAVIENASLNRNHLCSTKQIKLLMTPLKARLSKEPEVLLKRFDTFIRLLSILDDMAMLCLEDFLKFCFGPFDDVGARPQLNKRIPDMCRKSTVALFDILGHGHCKDENCVRHSFIEFKKPLMVPANFTSCHAILIDSVLECCIILPSWNSSASNATVVVKCLWFSLLQLCKASDNDTKKECWTKITNKLRALSEKIADNEFCSTVLGGFVEASAILEIAALNEVLFDISMTLLCRATEPVNFNVDKIESLVYALLESDNAKCSKIALCYFDNDTDPTKMSFLCNVWLKCPQSDVSSLLWPIRHLKHFKDLEVFETTWKDKYVKCSSESEPVKMSILQKLEGLFAENPLLSPGIILILYLVSSCDSTATSDFVTKSMRLLGSVLTFPNLSDEDIKTSISIILLHLGYIGSPPQEGADEAINKLCTSVHHLITVHKNFTILPMLEDFLKNQSETCLAKFGHHLVPFLESVLLDDESALNICGKLLELLDVKELEQPQSTPKLTSRSLRMLSMAKKSPGSVPGGLRLFPKTKETPPAKTSSPSTRSKLLLQNTPPAKRRKMMNVSIDEEKSSDFVKIDTPVKFEPKKLSEHQKEVMLKRREDIPALYQDLSQSQDWSLSQESSKSSQAPTPPSVPVETTKSCNNNNESTAMKVSSFKKPRIGKKQRTVKTDLDSSLDSSIEENSGGSGGSVSEKETAETNIISEKVSPSVASETASDMFPDAAPIIAKETESSDSNSVDETVTKDASDAEDVPRPGSKTKRRIKDQVETPTQVRKSLRQKEKKSKEVESTENIQTTDTGSHTVVSVMKTPTVAPIEKMIQTPVLKAQTPVSRVQTPIPKAQTPISRAQTPIPRAQTPIPRAQTPISKAQASVTKAHASVPKTKTLLTERAETPAKSSTDSKTQTPAFIENTPTKLVDVDKIDTPLKVDSSILPGSVRLKSQRRRSTSISTPLKRSNESAEKTEKETSRKKTKEPPSKQKAVEHDEEGKSEELDRWIQQKLLERSSTFAQNVTSDETDDTVEHVKVKAEVEVVQQTLDNTTKTKRKPLKLGEKRERESLSPEQTKKRPCILRKNVDSSIVTTVEPKSAEKRKVKLKKIEEFWPGIRKNEILEPETIEGEVAPQVDTAKTETEVVEAEDAAQVSQIGQPEISDEKRSEFLEHLQLKSKSQMEEEKPNEALQAAEGKRQNPRKSQSPGKRTDIRRHKRSKDPFLVSRKKATKFSRVKKHTVVRHVTAETSEVSETEAGKSVGVVSSPKVPSPKPLSSSRVVSRLEIASSKVASPTKVLSSPKVSPPSKITSPKAVSPPKVASPLKGASPPKVASPKKDVVDEEEAARRDLVARLLVQEETALKMQENSLKFAALKPCHVQLEAMLSRSLPTSPVKLPEMRRRAHSVDDIREPVDEPVSLDETKRKLRPRSFPEDTKNKPAARTINFSASSESTLGSQDIIESSQTTVVEMPAPAKRVTRQSTSPKTSPSNTTPKTISPSDSLADTESCVSVVKSLSPKDTTPPRELLTNSERLMADMSTETMHMESFTPQNSRSKELHGSPVGCDTPELVSEFLQSTSDISPICTPHHSFEDAKDGPAPARPQSLLPVKMFNPLSSARGTRLLQMVNPDSILKKDPVGVCNVRKRKMEQPKRKEQPEILTFSREIPSPLTVPGNSILKRKLHHSDDIHLNPPKRKRVNFSDPAITEKKIYLTDFPDLDSLEDVTITPDSAYDRWPLLNGNERKEFNLEDTSSKKSIIAMIRYFCDKQLEDDDFPAIIVKLNELLDVSIVKEIIIEFLSVVDSRLKNSTAIALAEETDRKVILETKLVPLLKTKDESETYVDIFIFFLKKLTLKELQDFIGQLRVLLGNEFEQHFTANKKENGAADGKEATVINTEPTTVHQLLDSAKRIVGNLSEDDKREFFFELMKFTTENCIADDQTVAMQMRFLLDLQRRKMGKVED